VVFVKNFNTEFKKCKDIGVFLVCQCLNFRNARKLCLRVPRVGINFWERFRRIRENLYGVLGSEGLINTAPG
jgi:hypothetical protein